jgi:hypothetical protein
MRSIRMMLGTALAFLVLSTSWALAVTPTPVKTTRNAEVFASGNADYFAWNVRTRRHPNDSIIKVDPTAGAVFSLNEGGRWYVGDMDQTGSLLPYARITGSGNRADANIHIYDMSARVQAPVPPNVNTSKLEYFPAISANQLTFIRRSANTSTLWLVTDRSTGAKIPVVSVQLSHATIANPPNLIGNWVTYAICKRRACAAYRYDIALGTTVKVPNPNDQYYFAPAADLAGNVYLERSAPVCGHQAKLMKWTGTGNPTAFYSFAPGHDMTSTSVYDDGAGNVTLYADVYDCASLNQDIVSFLNP